MIISIKPHSSIQKFFNGTDIRIDVTTYSDVLFYLDSLQPRFVYYIRQQVENGLQEVFSFLDKNLREINKDEMFMRKAQEDDIIYIVPAIVGGGGKRGALALLAIAALVFFAPAIIGIAPTATVGIMGTQIGIAGALHTIGLNLALMGITMLFMPKQKAAETSRDNDAFGSLVNTTASGTPIALNYGLVRVGGQLISGYVKTIESEPGHDKKVNEVGL